MPISRATLTRATTALGAVAAIAIFYSCRTPAPSLASGDAAERVYVAPGTHDELYAFLSGGFNGQVGVYGLPSGRLLKFVSVFSQHPERGLGYTEKLNRSLE